MNTINLKLIFQKVESERLKIIRKRKRFLTEFTYFSIPRHMSLKNLKIMHAYPQHVTCMYYIAMNAAVVV